MGDALNVTVSSLEQRIIINALNKLKEYQIKQIGGIVVAGVGFEVCDARPIKEKGHRRRYFEER